MSLIKIKKELKSLANPKLAKVYMRFFKTGKGEYGEGDKFLGMKVGPQRQIAKKYKDLALNDIAKLLDTNIHEYRLVAVFILIDQYKKADEKQKKEIFNFYLKHKKHINNWDLVDVSTPQIVGNYLLDKPEKRKILYKLAKSKNLWDRRIAIMATFPFIKNKDFKDTLKISKILLNDDHDLIHKAVGWMLREMGKMDQTKEEEFLEKYYKVMPRTMLRYSIEKFSDKKRKYYMKK